MAECWLSNGRIQLQRIDRAIGDEGFVHQGFQERYLSLAAGLLERLQAANAARVSLLGRLDDGSSRKALGEVKRFQRISKEVGMKLPSNYDIIS